MNFLLDTNVISELARSRPHPNLVNWFRDVADDSLYLSVLSLGEIRKGVETLADSLRKQKLEYWLEHEIPAWFEERLLPVTAAITDRWGRLLAEAQRSVPAIDSLLAATAFHHQLHLVTRNTADFRFPGLSVVNPWA